MARALIIEDDDALREELTDLLESWGFDAVSVATGEAACAAHSAPFDVILCDYRLRTETGLDVLRALNLGRSGKTPRVYLMTGHLDLSSEAHGEMEARGFGLLRKPLSAAALREALTGVGA